MGEGRICYSYVKMDDADFLLLFVCLFLHIAFVKPVEGSVNGLDKTNLGSSLVVELTWDLFCSSMGCVEDTEQVV